MMNKWMNRCKKNENLYLCLQILLIMLASRLFMLICMGIYDLYMGRDSSVSFLMNEWDAKRYQFMIDNGYTFPQDIDPQANWAFFPMYVLVCMGVKLLTFWQMDTYWVGMLVSNVCIFIAAFYAVRLLRMKHMTGQEKDVRPFFSNGLLIALLMMWAPYSFYFASTYTESLFVLFIVLFFYFCSQRRFVAAGLMAAFASATRIVGCLLVFALLVELFQTMQAEGKAPAGKLTISSAGRFLRELLRMPERIFALLLCPLGTFVYMTFLHFFCGDVWAFKNVQIAWREDYYFPIIGVMWKACTGQIEFRYTYMGWFCVAMFALYGYMIYRKRYSMATFGIISLLVPLTSHVMSTCRFTAGAFVAFVGLYDLLGSHSRKFRIPVLIFFLLAETWILFMWYNSDCWLM